MTAALRIPTLFETREIRRENSASALRNELLYVRSTLAERDGLTPIQIDAACTYLIARIDKALS